MVLNDILKNLKNVKIINDNNIDIKEIFSDSKKVTKNSLFISISNSKEKKYEEIAEAVNKGAAAIVFEDEEFIQEIPKDIVKVLVNKTNIAKAAIACNFYKHPSTKSHIIGVTGTKGKTITSILLREVLVKAGKKVGLITNLFNVIGDKIISKDNDFLDAIDLQKLLSEMVKEELEYIIIEVPVESIGENRVLGCKFSSVIYTNMEKDGILLKPKQSLEEYVEIQNKIFKWSDLNIINNDDFFAEDIIAISKKYSTYGVSNRADYIAIDINCRSTKVDYLTQMEGKTQRVVVNIPGRYMVSNSLSVVVLAMQLGIQSKHVLKALEEVVVPGVKEVVNNKYEIPVIIDSAKNIKQIENILVELKPYATGNITTVIGCDNTTEEKTRKFIGEILGKLSDNTIVTTYNPRDKNPTDLGKVILSGIREVNGKGIQIDDRKEAIEFALSKAQKRDIVLLLGMGDERFLEIDNEHVVFDERKIVDEYYNKNSIINSESNLKGKAKSEIKEQEKNKATKKEKKTLKKESTKTDTKKSTKDKK